MRYWLLPFVITLILSCGQTGQKHENGKGKELDTNTSLAADTSSRPTTSQTEKVPDVKPQIPSILDSLGMHDLRYGNWDSFWVAFKEAALRKDTFRIVQLTSFPFKQNSFPSDPKDFADFFAKQVLAIKKTSEPIYRDLSMYTGTEDTTGGVQRKLDSVYSLYLPHVELDFVRINGYYKFYAANTPG